MSQPKHAALASYPQSRMSPFDETALRRLLDGKKDISVLEIGSWLGAGSTRIFSEYAREIVCIDHWQGNDNDEHRSIRNKVDPFHLFRNNTSSFADRVVAINSNSSSCAHLLKDEYFDFVFIDGDHRYGQTLRDIKNFRGKVRRGGLIAGHDCEGRASDPQLHFADRDYLADHVDSPISKFRHVHPGVIKAVHELFSDDVTLFADELLHLDDGSQGYSTIWYKKIDA